MSEFERASTERSSVARSTRVAAVAGDATAASSASATETLARLEAFLSRVPLGILFLDDELRIERVNGALATVLGGLASPAIGRDLETAAPQVAEQLLPVARRVLATGEGVSELSFSGRVPNEPSRPRHWLAAIFPVTGDHPMTLGIVIRDVTERAEAIEREWRRVRRREGMHGLSAALAEAETPEDVVRAIVTHTTEAFGAAGTFIARCTPDGRHLELLDAHGMPPDVADEWRRFPTTAPVPLAYVARTGTPLFLESEADWQTHFPELAALATGVGHPANAVMPLMIEQTPVGALGIAFTEAHRFDEDERAFAQIVARQCALALERARLLKAEREARAAAVRESQVKTKFLATISHELRTPLNAIAGYVELLELEIHGPLTPAQRDDLGRIHRNLQHLLGLVGNVLSLLKLESGRANYVIGDVPLDAVIQFVGEAMAPQLAAKQLHGEVGIPSNLVVRADAEKVRQILLNLLSNAVKFTPEGGAITTSCSADEIVVRIDVRDTGRGIAPDQLERVFDPFVQVDQRLNQPTEGSGLGLAISRELARGMGGELTVSSALGIGSTFTLSLPRANS
jgi:signal transduction histidine kinase